MYLPHINSNPTPSKTTTNISPTYITPSSPSYTTDTALRHNTRLINKNKELQDTLTKARKLYKTLKQERNQLQQELTQYSNLQKQINQLKINQNRIRFKNILY